MSHPSSSFSPPGALASPDTRFPPLSLSISLSPSLSISPALPCAATGPCRFGAEKPSGGLPFPAAWPTWAASRRSARLPRRRTPPHLNLSLNLLSLPRSVLTAGVCGRATAAAAAAAAAEPSGAAPVGTSSLALPRPPLVGCPREHLRCLGLTPFPSSPSSPHPIPAPFLTHLAHHAPRRALWRR